MSIERELSKRSESKCELCGTEENLKVYTVLPTQKGGIDEAVLACTTCINQIENPSIILAATGAQSRKLDAQLIVSAYMSFKLTTNISRTAGENNYALAA